LNVLHRLFEGMMLSDASGAQSSTRRQFLREVSLVAMSTLALPHTRTLQAQAAPLQSVRLSDDMYAVLGPDANALIAGSSEGTILVDGGGPAWAPALVQTAEDRFAGQPVNTLFNTHWHPEHTGANLLVGERGARIVAHENTRLWLGTEVWVRWSDKRYPPLPEAALPNSTFYDSGKLRLGERKIEYGYMLNAHTDGDIWVFFPEENVLVTGGPVSNAGWPVIDWWTGGWIGGMLDGFDTLLEVADERTRIVPAHGPIMSLAELRLQHEMYLTIFDRIHTMLRSALETEEVLAAKPTAEYDSVFGDPRQFVTLAFQSMWGRLRDAHDTRMQNIA
jgi:glyoxylase-like metal-dependent hydrolase (beta-lactamase superfamily II)